MLLIRDWGIGWLFIVFYGYYFVVMNMIGIFRV